MRQFFNIFLLAPEPHILLFRRDKEYRQKVKREMTSFLIT